MAMSAVHASDLSSNVDIQSYLLNLEDDLLFAINNGPRTLASFMQRLLDLQSSISDKPLDSHTAYLVRSVATAGIALTRFSSSVNRVTKEVEAKRKAELDKTLKSLGALSLRDDRDGATRSTSGNSSKSSTKSVRKPTSLPSSEREEFSKPYRTPPTLLEQYCDTLPPLIILAHSWLLKHIHNPYPSTSTKARIANASGASRKAVSEWFSNVRRRIGWNSIARQYFQGDRALVVDAARNIFLGETSKVSIGSEIRDAFLALKARATSLFDGKVVPSDIVKQIDVPLRGDSLESQMCPRLDGFIGRKRRVSDTDSDSSTVIDDLEETRPQKYRRSIHPVDTVVNVSASSNDFSVIPHEPIVDISLPYSGVRENNCTTLKTYQNHEPAVKSRKRRISDSDTDNDGPLQKRICSISSTESINDAPVTTQPEQSATTAPNNLSDLDKLWASFDFTMPPCIDIDSHIPEGNIDLDCFDFSTCLDLPSNHSLQGTSDNTGSVFEFNSAPSPLSGDSFPTDIAAISFPAERELDSGLREPDLGGLPAEMLSFCSFDESHPFSLGSCLVPGTVFSPNESEGTFIGNHLPSDTVTGLLAPDIAIPLCRESTADSQPMSADSISGDEYIDTLLRCDRQIKLERLAYLREEKERIAKQEREIELLLTHPLE